MTPLTRPVQPDDDDRLDVLAIGPELLLGGTAAPANTAPPAVTGSNTVGSTLTCASGTWSNTPALTYHWLRGGAPISGAQTTTYVLTAADVGWPITCLESAINGQGSGSALSNATAVPAAAAQLSFQQQPGPALPAATLPPVAVAVQDRYGNLISSATAAVTVALHAGGPGAGTLSGTLTQNAVAGVATFNDLAVSLAGGYRLDATAAGLLPTTSTQFLVK
jgi:hypothetical protein